MSHVIVEGVSYKIDTARQEARARKAVRRAGLESAPVWAGDPDGLGDSYLTGSILSRGPGRPPVPESQRRDAAHRLPIYPSADERAVLDAWAVREGQPLGRLVLDRALRAARRS